MLKRLLAGWSEGKTVSHHSRLGSVLVDLGCLTSEQLAAVLQRQSESGGTLGYWARKMKFVSENELTEALSRQLKIPWIDDARPLFDRSALGRVPQKLCLCFRMVPLTYRSAAEGIVLGLGGPVDLRTIHMLRKMLASEIKPFFTAERTVDELLDSFVAPFIDEHSEEMEIFEPTPESLTRKVLDKNLSLTGSRLRLHLFGDTIWVRFQKSSRVRDIFFNLQCGAVSAQSDGQKLPIQAPLGVGERAAS